MSNPNEVKVKKYSIDWNGEDERYEINERDADSTLGDWVKYSDYQSLESQLSTANAKIVELEATQLSLDDICYRKLNSELEAELSTANTKAEKLVEALERLCPFLNNPQWGNWDYMEGSNVYTDIRNAKETVEQAINEFKGEK